jgi:pimeloyl-[acyl-carrier protein] methyl ester esterase
MKPTVSIISGWAHGIEAIRPMGDALAERFEVRLLTGAEVLREKAIPASDAVVTGSMGGLLAMELLPVSCKKLVLISSTARFCAEGEYACGTHEKILRRMIAQLKRDPEAVLEEFFKNVHGPQRESRQAAALRHGAMPALDDLAAGLEYLLTADVRDKVPSIGIPVLLLHGTEDRIIPASASEWLHARLPDSQLKLFTKIGHALPAHRFAAIMAAVQSFLQP